jgi:hypothetical protein
MIKISLLNQETPADTILNHEHLFFPRTPRLFFLKKSIRMDLGIFQVHDAEVVPFGLSIVIGSIRLAPTRHR